MLERIGRAMVICIICMAILIVIGQRKTPPKVYDHTTDEHGHIKIESNDNHSHTIGDFEVDIEDAVVYGCGEKHYLIVDIKWTNNSEKTTSFRGNLMTRAYQNNEQLKAEYLIDDYDDKLDKVLTLVKPGESFTITKAFVLKDLSTSVEVEVSCKGVVNHVVHKVFDF